MNALMKSQSGRCESLFVACTLGLVWGGCGGPADGDTAADPEAAGVSTAALTTTMVPGGSGWTYVTGFSGVKCIDGSSSSTLGLGVRLAPAGSPNANKLVVHVDGGGACFSKPSCDMLTEQNYNFSKFSAEVSDQLHQGIWDKSVPLLNPVDDWNHVFIPYCTGDLHAGYKPNADRPPNFNLGNGAAKLQYVGYANMTVFLNHVVNNILPGMGSNRRVIFSGESGGGWGVMFNAHRFRAMLPANVTLSVVDDSAPLMSNATINGTLQSLWKNTWNLGTTFLPACGAACTSSNWIGPWADYMMNTDTSVRWGLVSANGDTIMRWFFGLSNAGCTQTSGLAALADPDCYVSQAAYSSGLLELRSRMQAAAAAHPGMKTGTFFLNEPDGFEEQHEWLGYDRFYDLIEGCEAGVCMNSWFNDIADDVTPLRHVGP
jgi:hypothetical protein